ncbi:MAG: ribonuclease HI [Bacillota bacterium]|uniref:ribonuclease HI n=1 Tax=Desulfurispora thermophila TaxID=265470 RepID=UPI00037EC92F|nr:ribonuclease HI [Desulfurispora thermophila]
MLAELPQVEIYTDGACTGNPGPGGYGVILKYGDRIKELSGGFALTTNNRMEILAAIVGLEALKRPCQVTLFSDSRYLVDAVNQSWVERWRRYGWKKGKNGEPAKNVDLWQRLLPLLEKHRVTLVWVKGHADNHYNNRCDQLAVQAAGQPDLPPDPGYQAGGAPVSMLF